MRYTGSVLAHRRLNAARALAYGFKEEAGCYRYSAELMRGMFMLTVRMAADGQVDIEVIDTATTEEYVLVWVHDAQGEFVGQIREECYTILEEIARECCTKDLFTSQYATSIIQYVRDTYQGEPEYLWEKFPKNAILRETASAKWYAVLLTVLKTKVGIDEPGESEILNVKCSPDCMASLVDGIRYLPAYHMNKKHWLTIRLDGSVPLEEICRRIDMSYTMVKKK